MCQPNRPRRGSEGKLALGHGPPSPDRIPSAYRWCSSGGVLCAAVRQATGGSQLFDCTADRGSGTRVCLRYLDQDRDSLLDNPSEYGIHNDTTPLMFVLVVVCVGVCCIKSWLLYAER